MYDAPAEDVRKNAARARGDMTLVPFEGEIPAEGQGSCALSPGADNPLDLLVPSVAFADPVEANIM